MAASSPSSPAHAAAPAAAGRFVYPDGAVYGACVRCAVGGAARGAPFGRARRQRPAQRTAAAHGHAHPPSLPLRPRPAEGEYASAGGAKRKHGKGKYADGHASYQGDWEGDRMHGTGEFCLAGAASDGGTAASNGTPCMRGV